MAGNVTELVFVLDESGSMYSLRSDTIGGINKVLDDHRDGEGEAFVTIVTFSDSSRTVVEHAPIAEVKNLTENDYAPAGCTALLDALGDTIKSVYRLHKQLPKDERPNTIVVVMTDGEENASHRFDNAKIKKLVKKRREKDGWEFLFLGANIDAFAAAESIGISKSRASRYVSDKAGTDVAFATVSSAMECYRASAAVLDDWSAATEQDAKARVGD